MAGATQNMQGEVWEHCQDTTKFGRKVAGARLRHHKICKESCGAVARTLQNIQEKLWGRDWDTTKYARKVARAWPGHNTNMQ